MLGQIWQSERRGFLGLHNFWVPPCFCARSSGMGCVRLFNLCYDTAERAKHSRRIAFLGFRALHIIISIEKYSCLSACLPSACQFISHSLVCRRSSPSTALPFLRAPCHRFGSAHLLLPSAHINNIHFTSTDIGMIMPSLHYGNGTNRACLMVLACAAAAAEKYVYNIAIARHNHRQIGSVATQPTGANAREVYSGWEEWAEPNQAAPIHIHTTVQCQAWYIRRHILFYTPHSSVAGRQAQHSTAANNLSTEPSQQQRNKRTNDRTKRGEYMPAWKPWCYCLSPIIVS